MPYRHGMPGHSAVAKASMGAGTPLARHLHLQLAEMHPACFALSMATGVVAIASQVLGLDHLALPLSWINLVSYPALWILFVARAAWFPRRVLADWTSHQRAPGYFTVIAATAVLGAQSVLIHRQAWLATALWWVSLALWIACTYSVFALLTVRKDKPDLAEGINGGWLLTVVATQSITVLGCALGGRLLGNRDLALFGLLSFWLCGGMLYLWTIGLIFYRYLFFRFSPQDLMPPYWINMGAVAISTLAGALLAAAIETSEPLRALRPFVLGITLTFWATATWWIPMLLVLGIWRHQLNGVRIVYDPLYWGLVFPLGMYSLATLRLSEALALPALASLARVFVAAAAAAWLLTFLGLGGRLVYVLLLALRGAGTEPCGAGLMPRAPATINQR